MNEKREARKQLFQDIHRIRQSRNGPTLFNPWFEIKPRAVQDPQVSSKTGPQLRTQQWEATGRRPK